MRLREILTEQVYFVTGIDTDAGKSVATGWLSRKLLDEGVNVVTQKLIQTGCQGISEDIILHRQIEGRDLLDVDRDNTTNPLLFNKPCSPHMAAELEGRRVEIEKAIQSTEELARSFEMVLVEGAGGLMVPISRELLTIEYIEQQEIPVILVSTAKLGSINHTLLSLESLRSRGIEVPLVIYNEGISTDAEITQDTHHYLMGYMQEHYPATTMISLPYIQIG